MLKKQDEYCPICRKVTVVNLVIIDTARGKVICHNCTYCKQTIKEEEPVKLFLG